MKKTVLFNFDIFIIVNEVIVNLHNRIFFSFRICIYLFLRIVISIDFFLFTYKL